MEGYDLKVGPAVVFKLQVIEVGAMGGIYYSQAVLKEGLKDLVVFQVAFIAWNCKDIGLSTLVQGF